MGQRPGFGSGEHFGVGRRTVVAALAVLFLALGGAVLDGTAAGASPATAGSVPASAVPAAAASTTAVQRIAGTWAEATAIATSAAEYPTPQTAKAVVLARSDFFSDALAGGPLAASVGGPLLITPGAPQLATLAPQVQAEIQRVLAPGGTVYILGGTYALSPRIDQQLQQLGYSTLRIAGTDEYATAVDVAHQLGDPAVVLEATGLSFQDALSAVPAAVASHGAILLTAGDRQAPETGAYLADRPSDTRYAIGGWYAAGGADPAATRVAGSTLYDTSAAVAQRFFGQGSSFAAATGVSYADALAGGVYVATRSSPGPMLLVAPSGPLPASVASYLSSAAPSQGTVFGGYYAVGDDVQAELSSAMATTPARTDTFTVQLAASTVVAENLSDYSSSQLTPLIQYADRSMATTDPLQTPAGGEMESGDRVVVTDFDIYWLDVVRRGGLLSGIWPITLTNGNPDFAYMPLGNEWEPNSLLPGAAGDGSALYDTGQGVNVLPTGGVDGSCTGGQGTFIIGSSGNCGIQEGPLTTSISTATSGVDHTYSVTGTLYQEGTAHDEVMTDAEGHSATLGYRLTYDFRDRTDQNYDYGTANGTAAQRLLTSVTLTASSDIDLGTLVMPNTSDPGGAEYPYRVYDYSSRPRRYFYSGTPCGPDSAPAYGVAEICEGSSAPSQWTSEGYLLPESLTAGDFVDESQSSAVGDPTSRHLTVMFPTSGDYRLPERVDHIWNQSLGVSSLDVDYFNGESVPLPAGTSLNLGFDLQTKPHA